jgi:hypothetical protein
MCRTIRAAVRHTGFFATSIRCFREVLVKDSSEDLRNRDLLSLQGRTREFTTTPMRARIERRNRKCPSRLAIRFSSAATHLKIRTADDFRGYSSGRHQGHQPAIRRRYSGVGSGCIADTTTRRWRSSPQMGPTTRARPLKVNSKALCNFVTTPTLGSRPRPCLGVR